MKSTQRICRVGAASALILMILPAAGCGGSGSPSAQTAAQQASGADATATTATPLTTAELDGYGKGIRRETEAVRAAQKRSSEATTPQSRGEAIQASYETATIPLGAEAAGLSVERYREVRETVHHVFQTLDFQGKIDGPLSMDMSRASEQMKARLARDAFANLPEPSATALRSRMDALVPLWIEYTRLTAVAG
jgi:hypothetical protein